MPKLPEYESWQAPWEKKDEEFDAESAKKFIYGLLQQNESLSGKAATAAQERDELKKTVTEAAREGESEAERLKRELETVKADVEQARREAKDNLRLRVALRKGLTEVQAKRLIGDSEEDLEADADELLESFGSNGRAPEDVARTTSRQPRRRVVNPGDPEPDEGSDIDLKTAMEQIPRVV